MTPSSGNGSPWRKGAMIRSRSVTNAMRNQEALKNMSQLERLTGMTEADWQAFHKQQRERVLARYGIK